MNRPIRDNHPHDAPTPRELVEAVRDYLAGDLLEHSTGRDRWLLRVAANALTIVERELRLGPQHAVDHRRRLDELGYPDDAALGAAIRAGDLDDRWAEVHRSILDTVRDKLAVANPDHLID